MLRVTLPKWRINQFSKADNRYLDLTVQIDIYTVFSKFKYFTRATNTKCPITGIEGETVQKKKVTGEASLSHFCLTQNEFLVG